MLKRYVIATFSGTKKQLDTAIKICELRELGNKLVQDVLNDINSYDTNPIT